MLRLGSTILDLGLHNCNRWHHLDLVTIVVRYHLLGSLWINEVLLEGWLRLRQWLILWLYHSLNWYLL